MKNSDRRSRSPTPCQRLLDRAGRSCTCTRASWWRRAEDPTPAPAEPKSAFGELLDAAIGGKPILDVVFRWEYAKQDAQQTSHAATARTRLGYQTGEFRGVSGLAEMVNTVSPKPSGYFDGVENNEGPQTLVADPERTDVNRAWLQFAKKEWAGLVVKGGRERFNFDDERWIGSVGWRQNEQTFDAAHVQTTLGVDKLLVQYFHTWEVNRIFADQGPAIREDFNPRGHFLNAGYALSPAFNAVGFAYLIDPDQDVFRSFGSQTYGVRFTGAIPINERLSLPYKASYAYQEDWGNNATSYGAHYFWLESGLAFAKVVTVSAGYEHLGSDTDSVVVTPFATAHKFNGYSDVVPQQRRQPGPPRPLRIHRAGDPDRRRRVEARLPPVLGRPGRRRPRPGIRRRRDVRAQSVHRVPLQARLLRRRQEAGLLDGDPKHGPGDFQVLGEIRIMAERASIESSSSETGWWAIGSVRA